MALGRKGRVAVPVDEGERLAGHQRLGLAVADEEELGRAGGPAEAGLAVLLLGHPWNLPALQNRSAGVHFRLR